MPQALGLCPYTVRKHKTSNGGAKEAHKVCVKILGRGVQPLVCE